MLPGGTAIVWTAQEEPFHVSAKFVPSLLFPTSKSPTASQNVVLTHETPSRYVDPAPAGVATATSFHAVPFHSSPKARPFALSYPTLMQNVEVAHDTASL